MMRRWISATTIVASTMTVPLCVAQAADLTPSTPAVAPAPASFSLFQGVEFHAQGEAGILGNSLNPSQGTNGAGFNFGQVYTDHANEPQLNQILLTVAKPIDPKETGYALGFTAQGLFGSDERGNRYSGIEVVNPGSRYQFGVFQAFAAAHLPWLTSGGIDVKAGLFSSPQGYEATDPSLGPFYSHSYIFNYAVTFNHTGVLTTTHLNPTADLYLGVDTGNQTTFGFPKGDPNATPAGFVGFGLNNLLDNKLTVLALSHIGPEQSYFVDANADRDLRFYNDVVLTYKINDAWTAVTELNYIRDSYGFGNGPATGYSIAQYFSYAYNPTLTFNVRGELFRDSQNFFVATPQDDNGFIKTQISDPTNLPNPPNLVAPNGTQGTTYGEISLGFTYKPPVPKPLVLVQVRPEIRYDRIVAGGPAFNNNTAIGGTNTGSRNQFLFGGDVTIGF